jgi:dTDP-4-dehydrorhamnose reductase
MRSETRDGNDGPVVWVTGAGGLIGSYLVRRASERMPGTKVSRLTRPDLDLLDFESVRARHRADRPEVIIHCAALSRSPDCQQDPGLARRMNVEMTRALCEMAHESVFVFLSSDLVFDGRNPPYDEQSRPNPLSVYGETKLEAEEIVRRHPRHLIARASLNGGVSPTGDRGFDEQMRLAWEAGRELVLFVDEFRCPIHASETARAICDLVASGRRGTFHVAGYERISRYDLGRLIASRNQHLHPRIRAASVRDYQGAPRPADLAMECGKVEAALGRRLPGITEWFRQSAG